MGEKAENERKKRKPERAVPSTFDVVFFIISTHDSVFFDLLSFFLFSMVISIFLGIG